MLSEILLQQTNAEKVIDPYLEISNRWPTVHALSAADPCELRPIFSDLGLFYRAGRLVSIAKQTVELYNGVFPPDKELLLIVNGIGGYTASCIVSFGYSLREAVVDTNVIRIISRFFGFRSEKTRPREDKKVWAFANMLLPQKGHVDYNYALLDFGAIHCTHYNPLCDQCRLNDICCKYS